MNKKFFQKDFSLLATVLLLVVGGFFVFKYAQATPLGDAITGLDVPDNVLQLGETTTRTATTTEDGASDWTSSASSTVATIDSITGVVEAIGEGTTTIAYATSTSGLLNSILVTVYGVAADDDPEIGEVLIGRGDVLPTDYTEPELGVSTITWSSSNTDVATIDATSGAITPVDAGNTTISYFVEETATGRIVARGSLEVTVDDPIAIMFDSIAAELEAEDIISNLDTLTSFNYTDFSGLYFEKWVDGAKMGRITFNSALDLSNEDTTDFLQALGEKLNAGEAGTIGLDFTGTTDNVALKDTIATIKFYGLDGLGFSDSATSEEVNEKLIAFDDEGAILDISELAPVQGTYVGACGVGEEECHMFTVDVNHFTTYEIDNTAPTNQDTVFPSNLVKRSGGTVSVTSADEEGGAIWFAPAGTTSFVAGSTKTTAGGTATSILAPAEAGYYRLYVIDAAGNVSEQSTARLTVTSSSGGGSYSGGFSIPGLAGNSGGSGQKTIAELQSILDSLVAQLRDAVKMMISQGKPVPAELMIYVQDISTVKITRGWAFGMSGEEVKAIQTILAKDPTIYPEGRITGYFGPATLAAVKRFQIKYGIAQPQDAGYGYVGPSTRAKLNAM